MNHFVFFLGTLGLALAGNVHACADPPRALFRDLVTTAPTVFTFRLTSAFYIRKELGSDLYEEYVVGHIQIAESLKGNAKSFRIVRLTPHGCGSIRMSVGQLYLAATSQAGPVLELWGTNQAILDLTRDFPPMAASSPAVDTVKSIIRGVPVPADFPREHLQLPLEVYPVPPAPHPQR